MRPDGVPDLGSVLLLEDMAQCSPSVMIAGTGPAFRNVPIVAKGIEVALAAWGRWIECRSIIEFDPRHDEMQFDIAFMLMFDPKAVVLISFKACEYCALEVVHDGEKLIFGRLIFCRKGQYSARVSPFPMIAINQGNCLFGIAPQDFRQHGAHFGLAIDPPTVLVIGRNFVSQ